MRILQNAQQLGLRLHGHLADFVQQQRAVLRHLEAAGAPLGGARERALLVAEQFAFDQRFRQRRAIDGDKRSLPPRAQRVHGARHQFLAGAAFAGDQHAGLARSGLLQQRKNLLHLGGSAHQFAERALVAELPLQIPLVGQQAGMAAGAADQHFQHAGLDGLFQKPVGPQFVHRLALPFRYCRKPSARWSAWHLAGIPQTLQQTEAVQPGHVQVGQNDVGREIRQASRSASSPSAAVSGVMSQADTIAARPLRWLASSSTIRTFNACVKRWVLPVGATYSILRCLRRSANQLLIRISREIFVHPNTLRKMLVLELIQRMGRRTSRVLGGCSGSHKGESC